MKNNLIIFFLVVLFLGFYSCGTTNRNAGSSLDWVGYYTGIIPGADSGINAGIALNSDGTYSVTYQYVDKSDEAFLYTGTFRWKDGNTVELDSKEIPPYYRVGKNTLTQLDMEGKKITGRLSGMYILKKK